MNNNSNQDDWKAFRTNHIFFLVKESGLAEQVRALLRDVGTNEEQIRVYVGEGGFRALDPEGRYHGFKARVLRTLQVFGEELPRIRYFGERIKKGDIGFAVPYESDEGREHIIQALQGIGEFRITYSTGGSFYDVPPSGSGASLIQAESTIVREPKILLTGKRQRVNDVLVEELRRYGRDVSGATTREALERNLVSGHDFDFVMVGAGLTGEAKDEWVALIGTLDPKVPIHLIPRTDGRPNIANTIPLTNELALLFKIKER